MYVEQMLIPTKVARSGMTVREVFEECSRANTPGLPFCDDSGRITGRVTLKHILKKTCLPEYLVEMARVLGEQLSSTQDMKTTAKEVLNSPVDLYVQEAHLSLTSGSSTVKALAMMEQSDTSYIYVVDEDRYKGVVTIHSLADTLAQYDNPSEQDQEASAD
jgi:CBS domain-containing protein